MRGKKQKNHNFTSLISVCTALLPFNFKRNNKNQSYLYTSILSGCLFWLIPVMPSACSSLNLRCVFFIILFVYFSSSFVHLPTLPSLPFFFYSPSPFVFLSFHPLCDILTSLPLQKIITIWPSLKVVCSICHLQLQ